MLPEPFQRHATPDARECVQCLWVTNAGWLIVVTQMNKLVDKLMISSKKRWQVSAERSEWLNTGGASCCAMRCFRTVTALAKPAATDFVMFAQVVAVYQAVQAGEPTPRGCLTEEAAGRTLHDRVNMCCIAAVAPYTAVPAQRVAGC
jgi:hypothetical protein